MCKLLNSDLDLSFDNNLHLKKVYVVRSKVYPKNHKKYKNKDLELKLPKRQLIGPCRRPQQ